MNVVNSFFMNDSGTGYSMSRLLMFGAHVVTSAVVLALTIKGEMNEGYFAMYIGAWSGTYMYGKTVDAKAKPA